MTEDGSRRDELATALGAVRSRVERACADAGRDPGEVTLIVVTKFFPASDVLLLHDLGVRHFGENRDQEAGEKFAQVRAALGEAGPADLVLHFIGQLQTNKAGHVASYADVVQSVDRPRLVNALDRGAHAADRHLDVLLQVDLDTRRRTTARTASSPPAAACAPRTPASWPTPWRSATCCGCAGSWRSRPWEPTPTQPSPGCERSRTAYASVTREPTGSRRG